jgi:voltage-gated potassium channel Kch
MVNVEGRRPTTSARLRYRFDLALARGPMVVIGYLGVVMLVIIVAASLAIWLLQLEGVNGGDQIESPFDAFWQALLRVLDPGIFAGDATWPTRFVGLLVTVAGIFLAGSLIGLIANAVDQQVEQLRKGRSTVIEEGHTLVLGWSPRLPTILRELVEANANQRRATVVVLADVPKDQMEDELRIRVPDLRTTRVVCRTGDPSRPGDLKMVAAEQARSIIVLAGDDGDAGVVKAVLSVRSLDPGFARAHVVAELERASHARTLRTLTDGRIVTVHADEVIANVAAQACHQAGLAAVFRELMDFEGGEIYVTSVPAAAGLSYADLQLSFEHGAVMGWIDAEDVLALNPPADAIFGPGYRLVAVADDDDALVFTGPVAAPPVSVDHTVRYEATALRILVIGWSSLGPEVLGELDEFLAPGSTVDLLVDPSLVDPSALEPPAPITCHATITVHGLGGGPEALLARSPATYDQVIVLGYRGSVPVGEADARTLLTLLTLDQGFREASGGPRVVAEVLDRTNVAVAQTSGVDDFIVSDELSSLMIAQLSERMELHRVFDQLFDAEGAFVSLRPASLYARTEATSFASIVVCAARRGETALGWRRSSTGAMVVNPPKSATVELAPDDQVLVLGPR